MSIFFILTSFQFPYFALPGIVKALKHHFKFSKFIKTWCSFGFIILFHYLQKPNIYIYISIDINIWYL